MGAEARKKLVAEKFREIFGEQPQLWSRAPGRVDLMGSHTDYNLGYVMTMTIDRDTWIAARPRQDGRVCIHSLNAPVGVISSWSTLEQIPRLQLDRLRARHSLGAATSRLPADRFRWAGAQHRAVRERAKLVCCARNGLRGDVPADQRLPA